MLDIEVIIIRTGCDSCGSAAAVFSRRSRKFISYLQPLAGISMNLVEVSQSRIKVSIGLGAYSASETKLGGDAGKHSSEGYSNCQISIIKIVVGGILSRQIV